ncbi:helix-turn-helix domain-containing protein [Streptomyces yerevanensis]|uniref:helix-turn-helix domain-containing protein n=1 Tax=Streptomyces yerevanensis TaxID=66378 RepID=UPI000AE9C730|nr:helix-turn-helix domain-containing protein [Streptomyces yerevanensis]
MRAVAVLVAGRTREDVAALFRVSLKAVDNWWAKWPTGGREALVAQPCGRRVGEHQLLGGAEQQAIRQAVLDHRPCAIADPVAMTSADANRADSRTKGRVVMGISDTFTSIRVCRRPHTRAGSLRPGTGAPTDSFRCSVRELWLFMQVGAAGRRFTR